MTVSDLRAPNAPGGRGVGFDVETIGRENLSSVIRTDRMRSSLNVLISFSSGQTHGVEGVPVRIRLQAVGLETVFILLLPTQGKMAKQNGLMFDRRRDQRFHDLTVFPRKARKGV